LPLMSYGGSSLVVMLIAAALILRVDIEARLIPGHRQAGRRQGRTPRKPKPMKARWRLW